MVSHFSKKLTGVGHAVSQVVTPRDGRQPDTADTKCAVEVIRYTALHVGVIFVGARDVDIKSDPSVLVLSKGGQ